MSFPPSLPVAIDALSGVPLLVLAALVASVRPRRKASLAFVVFAGGFGAAFVVVNLVDLGDPLRGTLQLVATPLYLAGTAGALALAGLFPRPLHRSDRVLVAVLAVFAGVHLASRMLFPLAPGLEFVTAFFSLSTIFALPLLALRFRAAVDEPRVQAQVALVTAAFMTYSAVQTGVSLARVELGGFTPTAMGWANYATVTVVGVLWLANTTLPGPAARTARNLALLVPALVLFGVVAVVGGLVPETNGREGFSGALRGVGAALLAYAILRYQWLGLDVKVKWTVKQSTVAAAFIGVFFIVSESASTFFTTSGLGPYLGIAAAGLLVFALAPLQRAAERVADVAMPNVRAPHQLAPDERRRLYLDQAKAAWADGNLSRDERVLLDRLRDGLGLSRDEASQLESEAAAA